MTADPKPVYLLAGGGPPKPRHRPDPLAEEALQQAGVSNPSVAYIGTASGDNAGFCMMISRLLRKAGAGEVRLAPLCGRRADPQEAMRVIESCDIVFVSGGDVEAGMDALAKRGMIGFLRSQYSGGKPFFGVSAGSIMLAKNWVRWKDPDGHSSAELFTCLGIAQVYCDTHDEEDDWEELKALTGLIPPDSISYGIPSGMGLATNPDGSVRALGGAVPRFKNVDGRVKKIRPIRIRNWRFEIRD